MNANFCYITRKDAWLRETVFFLLFYLSRMTILKPTVFKAEGLCERIKEPFPCSVNTSESAAIRSLTLPDGPSTRDRLLTGLLPTISPVPSEEAQRDERRGGGEGR